MRCLVCIFVISFFSLVQSFATNAMLDYKSPSPQTQMMTIGGSLAEDSSLGVDVIQGSITSAEGTPFNIQGTDVLMSVDSEGAIDNYSMGRRIAYWTLTSNTSPRQLTITATPLTHSTGAIVHYILRFSYRYQVGNKDTYEGGEFFIASTGYDIAGADQFYSGLIDADGVVIIGPDSGRLQITNSEIRVFIPEDQADYVNSDYVEDNGITSGAPAGAYNATVTITLQGS